MVTAWWSNHGLIHYNFIISSQSITTETYCNELDNMMKNLTGKQLRLVNRDRSILLHDNPRPQIANQTQLKILELNLETIDHQTFKSKLPTSYLMTQYLWINDFLLRIRSLKNDSDFKSTSNKFLATLYEKFAVCASRNVVKMINSVFLMTLT